MNVMAIGAHPDDIEFGCSGTLIRHIKKGDNVVYVCMTNTESKSGTTGDVLRTNDELFDEVKCATDKMGIKIIEFLDFKDLHVPFSFDSVSTLDRLIQKYKIDTIYTHWGIVILIKTTYLLLSQQWLLLDMLGMFIVMNKYQYQD